MQKSERYTLSINNNREFIYESFTNLQRTHEIALDPESLCFFSDRQLQSLKLNKQHLSTIKLHWVEGVSLITHKSILVPAQLVYVPYVFQSSEAIIQMPISTGAAASTSLNESLYNGICEIIERDSFMINYLNKIPSPRIDIFQVKNLRMQKIINSLKRYRIEPHIIDIATDIGIPSIAAILVDQTKLGPAISVGLKAGLDILDVVIGAIEETIMLRSWIRDKFIYTNPSYKRDRIIRSVEDRAHYWFHVHKIKSTPPQKSKMRLDKIIKLLRQKKMDIIYIDLTDKSIEKYGFKVVKVILPQLQPLYLDEQYSYFGGARLYSAPLHMGIFKKQKKENRLNKIPHPFL